MLRESPGATGDLFTRGHRGAESENPKRQRENSRIVFQSDSPEDLKQGTGAENGRREVREG
jgi:hypothetical protein